MSHFTVLVCVADENGSLNPRQLESQVVELMAPFQEDAQPGDNFFVTMRAHSLGLMDVKDSISEEEESRSKLREDSRYDVYSDITKSEFMERFISYFNPIQCYAALDENGWHAPGEVGFFGTSSDSPDEKIEFSNSFYQRFIKNKNPNDWLVVVDCHT